MSNPIRNRIPTLAAALILASAGVAACSSSGGSTSDGTTDSAAPTTEAVAPTTSTSTTDAPTSSTTVEDAIRAAHTRVMTELFARDERVTGPEAILPLAEELTTGPLLRRIQDDVIESSQSGERTAGPGYESHIVRVTMLAQDKARVVDCSLGRGERYAADGTLLIAADDHYKLRESAMVLVDGRWLASDIFSGGDEQCEPS
ncbi:MAG: hypothetical protein R2761_11150 [Acidimicrobiales bacterium]